jgi:hypothetical protein
LTLGDAVTTAKGVIQGRGQTTYNALLANGEFRALFTGNAAAVAGQIMQMLVLSALVYATTKSPLLAALAFFGGLLPQAVGALTLLSVADRVRPRGFSRRLEHHQGGYGGAVRDRRPSGLGDAAADHGVRFARRAKWRHPRRDHLRTSCQAGSCWAGRCSTFRSGRCRSSVSRPGARSSPRSARFAPWLWRPP